MSEQDIETQILEELQKFKEFASRIREAEDAYRTSCELLEQVSMQYSGLSSLKEEIMTNNATTKEDFYRIFSVLEQENLKKLDSLNQDLMMLKTSLPDDITSKYNDLEEQVGKMSHALSSASVELAQLKQQQSKNAIYIRAGFFIIVILAFSLMILKLFFSK